MKMTSEVFVLPDGERYLVYAPLRRLVLRTGEAGVRIIAALCNGQEPDGEASDPGLVSALRDAGILDGPPEAKPLSPDSDRYQPTRLTLFLTSECNLACRYCYASANQKALVMPMDLGMAAIDFVLRNASESGHGQAEIGFHGGGEPTVAWALLTSLIKYARDASATLGTRVTLGMSTNGCMGGERARWLAEHLDSASVSVDGPPSFQDSQRPLRDGNPSSPHVEMCMTTFCERGFRFSVQATVTRRHTHEMSDIVRYLASYKPQVIKLEPVSDAGRCGTRPDLVPDMGEFAAGFNRAFDVAREMGVEILFSGMRPWGALVSSFCGAFCEPLNVTPDGVVTACYETTSADAPYADLFTIGRYDPAVRTFVVDMERLRRLRERTVDSLSMCRNCFCKYTCGGDCATRNFRMFGTTDLMRTGARCKAIRSITQHRLRRFMDDVESRVKTPQSVEA